MFSLISLKLRNTCYSDILNISVPNNVYWAARNNRLESVSKMQNFDSPKSFVKGWDAQALVFKIWALLKQDQQRWWMELPESQGQTFRRKSPSNICIFICRIYRRISNIISQKYFGGYHHPHQIVETGERFKSCEDDHEELPPIFWWFPKQVLSSSKLWWWPIA